MHKIWLKNTLTLFATLIVCLMLTEGVAMIVESRGWVTGLEGNIPWISKDPYLGWKNKKLLSVKFVGFQLDGEMGYRHVTSSFEGNGPSVLFLGDSGTFGISRGDDMKMHYDSYPEIVASEMFAKVTNAGVVGYNISHAVRVLEKDEGKYDYVFLRYGWNEHGNPYLVEAVKHSTIKKILDHTATGRMLLCLTSRSKITGKSALTPEETASNLKEAIKLIRERGAKVAIIDYPIYEGSVTSRVEGEMVSLLHNGIVKDLSGVRDLHSLYQQAIKKTASEEGVPFLNTFLGVSDFGPNDMVHPNKDGLKKVAKAIEDFISKDRESLPVKVATIIR